MVGKRWQICAGLIDDNFVSINDDDKIAVRQQPQLGLSRAVLASIFSDLTLQRQAAFDILNRVNKLFSSNGSIKIANYAGVRAV